ADAAGIATQDRDVTEWPNVVVPGQLQPRSPHPAPQAPRGLREVGGSRPSAHLEDTVAIVLFGQPTGRHAAAKTGADHKEIEVMRRAFSHGRSMTQVVGKQGSIGRVSPAGVT